MNTPRLAAPGRTRSCPHCKATILESATVCPGCHHHLRFDPAALQRVAPLATALRVEGRISHPPDGIPCEYSVVVAVRNARGEEIARHVVGVGALQPTDERTFTLAVELFKPLEVKEVKPPPPRDVVAPPRDPRLVAQAPPVQPPGTERPQGIAPRPGAQPGPSQAPSSASSAPGRPPGVTRPSVPSSGQGMLPLGAGENQRTGSPQVRDPKLKPKDP